MSKTSAEKKEDGRRKIALQKKFAQRITIARQAREAFLEGEYIPASKKYHEYLQILTEMNDLPDIYSLRPEHFDIKKQVTELLLIAHVYWDLARVYEMTPKLQPAFINCLDQFVRFTVNMPYQVLNAEMLRKYIKKNKNRSNQITRLNEAYARIFVQSSKCYIASHLYGEQHPITQELRLLKNNFLINSQFGLGFIRLYYNLSPRLIKLSDHNILVHYLFLFPFKFLLPTIAFFTRMMSK